MAKKPTYEELEQKATTLENEIAGYKKEKEAAERSQEKYRGLVENSFDGIFVQIGSKIIFSNHRLNEMLGYDQEELWGLDHWLIYHPDYRDMTRRRAQARMRGERVPQQYEVKLQRRDGSWLYGEISARSITLEQEPGIQVWVRDITDQKKAEEELKTRRNYLESVLRNAPDAIVTLDSSHLILEWNPGAERIFGYTSHEVAGKNLDDLIVNPDAMDEARTIALQVLSGKGIHPRETVRYRKDHTPVNVIVAASPIFMNGEVQGVVAVYTDITEHKRTEEFLKRSEEKYRNILECIEEAYYEVDIAGNFVFFNDSICKLLGYSRDELMGMNPREYIEKEALGKLYKIFNRVYRTGKPESILDWEIVRKDNTKRYVEASVSLTKDFKGNSTGFRGVARDITEKMYLQAQVLQAKKMEAVGTLAGGIAHNFNNLLMSVQGNTTLMLLDTPSDHPYYKRLTNIEKLVKSGSELTGQLLGYARGGKYELKPISINSVIKETSATFAMTRKDIAPYHDLEPELSLVRADRGQIEQVILNIYINASEAMPRGGELYITTKNIAHTDIERKPYKIKAGSYVFISIRDTGIGMDKATQEKIFDPFFTTKGLARRTGLSLPSVYGIVKAHDGYIDVQSIKGRGTTFFLYLPASAHIIDKKTQSVAMIEKGKGSILLVDDEEIVLDVGEALLSSLGYTVSIAHGGKEAIETLRASFPSSPPDLVILDMIMPHAGGGETYDRMKELYPSIKVLLSSGYSIDGQAKEILDRGCNGFIQKPFTLKDLSKIIKKILTET